MTGKYRIIVKGIVENKDKVLIVKKWYDDRITDPYQWEFIDDKMVFGEKPEETVLRKIKEDTGIDANISDILYTWTFIMGDTQYIGISYLCNTSSDTILVSDNINGYKWVNKNEIKEYVTSSAIISDLEKIGFIS